MTSVKSMIILVTYLGGVLARIDCICDAMLDDPAKKPYVAQAQDAHLDCFCGRTSLTPNTTTSWRCPATPTPCFDFSFTIFRASCCVVLLQAGDCSQTPQADVNQC